MICFRSTSPQFGTEGSLFSGQGAEEYPGRWNKKGTKAIYSSLEVTVAAAERAHHSLIAFIKAYNDEVDSRPGRFPRNFHEQILNRGFSFGKIRVDEEVIDLTNDKNLSHWLSLAGLPGRTGADARFSYYQKNHLWTREFGSYIADQGHPGIIVPSARSDEGSNAVFFEQNLPRHSYEILEIVDLKLSASAEISPPIREVKYGERAHPNKVSFSSNFGSGSTEVMIIV